MNLVSRLKICGLCHPSNLLCDPGMGWSMGTNVTFIIIIIIIIIIITFCLAAAFGRFFETQAHGTAEIRGQLNVHMV